MNHKAAVFDLDGTLLDTLQDLADAVNYALKVRNLPERSIDEVREFVGNGIVNLIVRARPGGTVTDTFDTIKDDKQAVALHEMLLDDFKKFYGAHCEDNTKPYDGILDVLRELKCRGIKIAVVSNKADFAVKKLCPAYFGDLVDVASGEDEAHGIGKKPAPEMVYRALDEIGVGVDDAIYIGDSDVDIDTARNSGMPCISVLWGFRNREFLVSHGADIFVEEPEQLLELI